MGGAVFEVVAHEFTADGAEGFVDGGELGEGVGAVAVVVDHLLEAADLAFDAFEAGEVAGFGVGVDGEGFFERDGVAGLFHLLFSGAGDGGYPLGVYSMVGMGWG